MGGCSTNCRWTFPYRGMVADKVAALTTSQAITAALFARNETGECQHVQVSMLEANIAFNWPDVMMHETVLDEGALHLPNLLGSYQLFSTSDGWVSVTTGLTLNGKQFVQLSQEMTLRTMSDSPLPPIEASTSPSGRAI